MKNVPHVTTIESAHEWTVDNQYIYHGYRKNFSNFRETIQSLFSAHNEVMNIWTHLIGAIIFIVFLIFLFGNLSQSKLLYQELQTKFRESEFLKSISAHSFSLSEYFKTMKIDENYNHLQNHLQQLKTEYTLKYHQIKDRMIIEEEIILRNIHQRLENTAHVIEEVFDKIAQQLQLLVHTSDQDLESYNDQMDKLLNINQLVNYIELIFTAQLEFYPVIVYTFCAITCLSLSAIFHSLFVMNQRLCKILQKCDYAGIVILIFGSSYAVFFYNFYCVPFWSSFYAILIGVFSIVCFVTSLSDYVDREEGKVFLGSMMGGLGISTLIPIIHTIVLSWHPSYSSDLIPLKDLSGFIWTGIFYLGGLAVYIVRFPEKNFPKKFDIWLNSHTIWHIFVFLGALSHYWTVLRVFQVRSGMTCSAAI